MPLDKKVKKAYTVIVHTFDDWRITMETPRREENPTPKTWWTAWARMGTLNTALVSVLAADKEEADREVEAQLKMNPGRLAYFQRWERDGRIVTEQEVTQ